MYQDQDPNPRKAEPCSSSCFSQALGGPSKWAALQGLGRFFLGWGLLEMGNHPRPGMVTKPAIKMVMAGGWLLF